MIKEQQIGLVKSYYKPLNKYLAGWGYRRNGKYYIRESGGIFPAIDYEIDKGFDRVTLTKMKDIAMDDDTKKFYAEKFRCWEEPDEIKSAAEYIKAVHEEQK